MKFIQQDIPWKEVLEIYFKDFILFFLPEAYQYIDWKHKVEFLDKEFQKLVGDTKGNKKILDKLARVKLKNGSKKMILIHVEIQGSYEKDFAKRMLLYYFRIWEKYKSEITSIAILTDNKRDWRPSKVELKSWNTNLRYEYKICKLLDYKGNLTNDKNVFNLVVLSHLKAIETQKNIRDRLHWKIELVKLLYEKGYNRHQIYNLFHFINWILVLPEKLEKRFENELKNYEEKKKMPYVTALERMYMRKFKEVGIEEGKKEGIKEGIKEGKKEGIKEGIKEGKKEGIKEGIKEGKKEGIKEGRTEGIQLGLEIKFNDKGLKLYKTVEKIKDLEFLEAFMKEIKKANDIKELQTFIKNYKQSQKTIKSKRSSISKGKKQATKKKK